MTTAIFGSSNTEMALPSGLYDGHEYSVLKLEMIRDKRGKVVRLVQGIKRIIKF